MWSVELLSGDKIGVMQQVYNIFYEVYMKNNFKLLYIFIFLIIPAISFGDAGTPLMWTMSIHLYLSNIIAAIIESIIIYIFYKTSKYYIVFLKILLGNIASAFIGYLSFKFIFTLTSYPKEEIAIFCVLLIITYIASILIEFPFFIWASPKYESYKKTFFLDIISNLFSYVVLIFLYFVFMGYIIWHI